MIRAFGLTMAPVLLLWLMAGLTPCEPQSGGYLIALSIISLAQLAPALSLSAAGRLRHFQVTSDWLSFQLAVLAFTGACLLAADRYQRGLLIAVSPALLRDAWVASASDSWSILSATGNLLLGFAPWALTVAALERRPSKMALGLAALAVLTFSFINGGRSAMLVALGLPVTGVLLFASPDRLRKAIACMCAAAMLALLGAAAVFAARAERSGAESQEFLLTLARHLGGEWMGAPPQGAVAWIMACNLYLLHSVWTFADLLMGTLTPEGQAAGVMWASIAGRFLAIEIPPNGLGGRFLPLIGCLAHDFGAWLGTASWVSFWFGASTLSRRWIQWAPVPLLITLFGSIALLAPMMNPVDLSIMPATVLCFVPTVLLLTWHSSFRTTPTS